MRFFVHKRRGWIYAVLVVFLVAGAGIGASIWAWNRMSGEDFRSRVTTGSTASSLASLLENTASASGDLIFLNDVRLEAGPTAKLFIVSGAEGQRMLLVSEAKKSRAKAPTIVDIRGRLRPMPSSRVLHKEWKLSKSQADQFREQRIYIAAEQIEPVPHHASNE